MPLAGAGTLELEIPAAESLILLGFRLGQASGGEGGIRTPDGLAPMPHFECGAFNHSATSPQRPAGSRRSNGAWLAVPIAARRSDRGPVPCERGRSTQPAPARQGDGCLIAEAFSPV